LRNPRVWALTLIYFGQNVTDYRLVLFLPRIVKRFGLSNVQTGFVRHSAALSVRHYRPMLRGRYLDRTGERASHLRLRSAHRDAVRHRRRGR
jgi:MFS transporter, ACS family, tartrate transporter